MEAVRQLADDLREIGLEESDGEHHLEAPLVVLADNGKLTSDDGKLTRFKALMKRALDGLAA